MFSQSFGRSASQKPFPTRPDLSLDQYPDVTSQFEDAKYNMYRNLTNTHHWNTPDGIGGLFHEKMQPGGEWDLNAHPDFPGLDEQGNTQYAQWNHKIVDGNFLNHHLLGRGIAGASHYPSYEDDERDTSSLYGEPLKMHKLSTLLPNRDAVWSGYQAYHRDNSWETQLFDPSGRPVLQGRVEQTEGPSESPWARIGKGVLKAGAFGLGLLSEYGKAQANPPTPPQADFRLASASSPIYDVPQRLPRVNTPPAYDPLFRDTNQFFAPPPALPEFRERQIPRPASTPKPQYLAQAGPLEGGITYEAQPLPQQEFEKPIEFQKQKVQPLSPEADDREIQPRLVPAKVTQPTKSVTQKPVPALQKPQKVDPHRQFLNAEQSVLNQLFKGPVFGAQEFSVPYEQYQGQWVDNRNIAQMIGVANWITYQIQQTTWNLTELQSWQQWLKIRPLTPAQERQLDIARRLNAILKINEHAGAQRDDAKALAHGLEILIAANTHGGKVNERQLIEDLKFFCIDQENKSPIGIASGLQGFHPSNAAYNLYGGPRIGTIGWKPQYWDYGRQYDTGGKLINQAHHFTAFLIEGMQNPGLGKFKARRLDPDNPQDVALGNLAIDLIEKVRNKQLSWQNLPLTMYRKIKL